MEIIWYGQACFRLKGRGYSVVLDPYPDGEGLTLPRPMAASIVAVSHELEGRDHLKGFRGSPYVISGPGEYEIGGIFVFGVSTFRDEKQGAERGKNTAYLVECDGLKVCHLGDVGHVLTQEQVEQLDGVDVLMVPVGARGTLSGTRAAEVVNLLEPSIVIPMMYKTPAWNTNLETERRFLREMAVEKPDTSPVLNVTSSQLPDETQVIVLEPQQ